MQNSNRKSQNVVVTIAIVFSTIIWGLVYARLNTIERELKKIQQNLVQLQVKMNIEPIAPMSSSGQDKPSQAQQM